MNRVLNRALIALDRYWKFEGSQLLLNTFADESPIQPVADVQRVVELGAVVTDPGAAGFFSVGQDNVHVGGDTVEATIDPYAALDAQWGSPGSRWVWLYRLGGSASSSAIFGAASGAVLAASIAALGNALARRDFLLYAWVASERTTITTDLSATFPVALAKFGGAASVEPVIGFLPFPLPPGSKLTWRTSATAAQAGTIRLETLCWVGPYGVMPPGLR